MVSPIDSEWLQAAINARSESEVIEFKHAERRFTFDELCDYCVAISNELGGHLIFGVADRRPRQILGSQAFLDHEKTANGVLERLGLKLEFTELLIDEKRVLIAQIPSRPKGVPRHHKGKYWMRAGESLVPMSVDELTKIINENKAPFEQRSALEECDAAKVIEILDTQCFYRLMDKPYPATRVQVINDFVQEKLILRTGASYTITNLGAIVFARDLRQFDGLAHKSMRVVVFKGDSKTDIKQDTIGSLGFAVGFEGLLEHLTLVVPKSISRGGAIRKESYVFPMKAIRELVANALVHQDFDDPGRVTVEVFESTLNVRNSGRPIIDLRRFIDSQHSRNESLAHLMRRLGICEELGSGIDIVVEEIEINGLPPYKVNASNQYTTVSLLAPLDFESMTMADRSTACFQHCVLVFERTKQPITNKSVRERFGLTDRQSDVASRIISQCITDGLIKLEDPENTSKKYARYVPFWV